MSDEQMNPTEPVGDEPSIDEEKAKARYTHHMLWLSGIFGAVLGAVLSAALIFYVVLPDRMILTYESKLGFDETVAALERAIPNTGWFVTNVMSMDTAVAEPNSPLLPRVKLVSMCKAEYAEILLRTDPSTAAMMPCTFAVWEGEDGQTYVSKTNMTVMARLFGGRVGDVVGRRVVLDERIILGDIVRDQ